MLRLIAFIPVIVSATIFYAVISVVLLPIILAGMLSEKLLTYAAYIVSVIEDTFFGPY